MAHLRASDISPNTIDSENARVVSIAVRFWESRAGRFHDYKICLFRRLS